MATLSPTQNDTKNAVKRKLRAEGRTAGWFDGAMSIAVIFFVIGLFIDGWAHNQGRADESFFTPYHALMYGSYMILGALLVSRHFLNISRGYGFFQSLPRGYQIALVGVLSFGVAGLADMGWHLAFGIEENFEALLSPTHLALAGGYLTIILGVLLVHWQQPLNQRGWAQLWPVVLVSTGLLSIMTFFLQYANYLQGPEFLVGFRPRDTSLLDIAGIFGYLAPPLLSVCLLLVLLRRWRLPFGGMTFILAVNNLLMAIMLIHGRTDAQVYQTWILMTVPAVVVGLMLDSLALWLRPGVNRVWTMRLMAVAIPFLLSLGYMAAMHVYGLWLFDRGLWWTIHMWLGIPGLAGLIGFLLSLVAMPPPLPEIPAEAP